MNNFEQPLDIETLLAGYVLGDLTPAETEYLQQHLKSHPELEAEVNSLQATLALLPLSLPESLPPQNMRSRILQAAVNESPTLPQTETQISQKSTFSPQNYYPQRLILATTASITAVLLGGLGWQNYSLRQQLASATQEKNSLQSQMQASQSNLSTYQQVVEMLNQPNNRFLTLKGMSPQVPASGSLVITPESQAAFLTLQNLTPLPQGKVYRMWAFVENKKVDCATFTPDSQGKVMLKIPIANWENTTSVMITIEPKQGITYPTGEKVMKGTQSI
ncbi:MAG TPA: anti-sigma factor [Nostocaceae cyanobacterium]|nr:anti-sigma factor [Nostocaceae cyanobacterium]